MKKIIHRALITLSVLVGVCAVGGTSHAAAVTKSQCTVTNVGYDGRLFVTCDGSSFFSEGPGAACAAKPTEEIRTWNAMLMSALMSGKKVDITYENACGGNNSIYAIGVNK